MSNGGTRSRFVSGISEIPKILLRPGERLNRGWREGRGFRQGKPRIREMEQKATKETKGNSETAHRGDARKRMSTNRILCGLCFLLLLYLDCPAIRAIGEIRGFFSVRKSLCHNDLQLFCEKSSSGLDFWAIKRGLSASIQCGTHAIFATCKVLLGNLVELQAVRRFGGGDMRVEVRMHVP